jgi:2-polyprenyl-3-methyl-5-hydroxy-6-metoxy-1,4-benzoquinol methylase
MKRKDLEEYVHPISGARLELRVDEETAGEVMSGGLIAGDDEFHIIRGIPRFCPTENYGNSFGYQWQKFSVTQLDSHAPWDARSEKRLAKETHWPSRMEGQRILEAGSGMGRFTEVLARSGARVCTFDYSAAVDANYHNNGAAENVCFAQADIYSPPYPQGSFDKVLCVGVLQHCPSPHKAMLSLSRFLKPGGEIVIDVYRLSWRSLFLGKYYLRPLTRRIPPETLYRFVRFHVGWVYPLTGLVQKVIGRPGRSLSWMLGMADYRGKFAVDDATLREHSLMDTFDMLAPAYDRPQTQRMVRRWFEEAGLVDFDVHPGVNGLEARGHRPNQATTDA